MDCFLQIIYREIRGISGVLIRLRGAFEWEIWIWISDFRFPIKREIQKRISTSRNPFPRWISIKEIEIQISQWKAPLNLY